MEDSYLVTWKIDVDKEYVGSPREAARYAREAQVREGTSATVFDVTDMETGQVTRVDLSGGPRMDYVIAGPLVDELSALLTDIRAASKYLEDVRSRLSKLTVVK